MSKITCIVLAAGQGTRMRSRRPKVLFDLMGKPLIVRLMKSLLDGPPMSFVVVVGHEAETVQEALKEAFPRKKFTYALQNKQKGTGHAVATARTRVPRSSSTVVVVNGDIPLLTSGSMRKLTERHKREGAALTLATTHLDGHAGYGRVLRKSSGTVMGIREERDCSPREFEIRELNAGLYCFSRRFLDANVARLASRNDQNEFYLTDLVEMASMSTGLPVADVEIPGTEVKGVNDRKELTELEEILLDRIRGRIMAAGVTMRMPGSIWIDETVEVGADATIGPRVVLSGKTVIGKGCTIGTGCVLTDTRVEDGAVLEPYCVTEEAVVRARAIVGPFARLRPGSDVGREAQVGNFVELKKTVLGEGSKANHLSYLGDGVIGRNVNVGAGTIFCNYDGFNKHNTVLEDDVFIGSDSQMVAPVTVGKGSYVASGSTITGDVPPDSLALARARQVVKKGRASMLRQLLKSKSEPGEPKKKRRRRRRRRKSAKTS
ncbi:MAG: bifunctional UDP-N-acetylglucosamine diphosphorylase/glucosamine-1-phosphate N-acetyltransferase GlmU [Deltaproteobacteria bacterium]|nr:bifunctional UDP-N-acetylglucosamine diphosphorylase/glucosamine-1-phosphate N-acetyltransferase GlmU [Deltaproteobacteria bacterium]